MDERGIWMRVSIVGAGYVGLCTGVGLASLGNRVICVDTDEKKISMIRNGKAPIFEKGLDEKLPDVVRGGMLEATTDCRHAVENSDITFIAVGTPIKGGKIDLSYIKDAAMSVEDALKGKTSYHVVAIKSTVVPGTTESLFEEPPAFGLCVNPEFLREGSALHDFMNPDRIIIGSNSEKAMSVLSSLYTGFNAPILSTDMRTAEMIKYASNAFLATKISFINEIGNLCKKLGIDTYKVAEGMGHDSRIGRQFLDAGIGFGGSCFRKDAEAILGKSGSELEILKATLKVNDRQPEKIVEILEKKTDIMGKTIAILGLAFKENTDDVRDSPAIKVIERLVEKGCIIRAYDPKASANMKNIFPEIEYAGSAADAVKGADACLILTAWGEFKNMTEKDFSSMKGRIILEGRRVLDRSRVPGAEGVCW